jgi:hypothetical protein
VAFALAQGNLIPSRYSPLTRLLYSRHELLNIFMIMNKTGYLERLV